jgi:hypothetical protein
MTTDKRRPAPQVARHSHGPGYWMYETSGGLRPAIVAYLQGDRLSEEEIALIRAYLRQWIMAPAWGGPAVDALRAGIDRLTTRQAIARWLDVALGENIDPL